MPTNKKVKVTVTTAEGNPRFLVEKGTSIKDINKIIRNKFGYNYNETRTARFPHEWISEEAGVVTEETLYLRQKIADIGVEKDNLLDEIDCLKKVVRKLKGELIARQIKINYVERTQKIDWIETPPEREDRIKARKSIQELAIRTILEHLEEKLASSLIKEIKRDEFVVEKDEEIELSSRL